MIERYSVPELTKIWSDENKFQTWLRVEIAVVQAWGNAGVIPQNDVQLISNNAKIHVPDIMQYIEETNHWHVPRTCGTQPKAAPVVLFIRGLRVGVN